MNNISARSILRSATINATVLASSLMAGCGGGAEATASTVGNSAEGRASVLAATTVTAATSSTATVGAVGVNPPIVFNASGSARAGQVVSLQGENFGSAPSVFLEGAPDTPLQIVNSVTSASTAFIAVQLPQAAAGALQLRVRNGASTSALVKLNAARPLHLDALELITGGAVRVFGRNLKLDASTPRLLINNVEASIDLARSDEHMLVATVPSTLTASRAAVITVDNGNGTGAGTLDRTVTVARAAGTDPFGLGVSWAAGFAPIAAHVVDAATDSRLSKKAVCDGANDDNAAIQAAIELAAADGGGLVQLPAGTCRLSDWLQLRSRVVLQGAGKASTTLRYPVNYPLFGVKLDLTGVRNLTLVNTGTATEGPLIKDSTHVVLQNVAFDIGNSRQMYFTGNRHFAVLGSDLIQASGIGGQGPYNLEDSSGLVFQGNTSRWATGSPTFGRVHDSVVANNRFSRDATDQGAPGSVHSMTLDFAYRLAVVGNTFDVIGGPLASHDRNDGETILTEGGSSARTENLGSVVSAGANTLGDPSTTLDTDPFRAGSIPENYGVAIVAGKGAGQTRRLTAYKTSVMTVDRAWDVVPDSSSRYATFVWGLEKSLIKGNVLSQNPRGVWLYGTSVREVDVVDNTITEGGGIYLRSTQELASKRFTVIYNVLVARNHIANTTRQWVSYVNSVFVNQDARAFGIATLGVELRDNQVVANTPNLYLGSNQEEYANTEGLSNLMRIESYSAPYESQALPRMLGTLVTGNSCAHCDAVLRTSTGAGGTTLVGNAMLDSATLLNDDASAGTQERSTDTVVLP
ncbi:MAG: hypothetical protein JWQ11_3822 [Rhizobacter sp.]|nr:hypothetical protein [Rhizobacter sp.]